MKAKLAAPNGEEFDTHTKKISNIRELYEALENMSDEQFSHFVNNQKHDFANWIEHSLHSKFLAARARRCKTRDGLRKELFIAMYL